MRRPPRLVLDEAEQRALHDRGTAIAERTAEAGTEEAVMPRFRNSLYFLAERTMRSMVRDRRGEKLRGEMLPDLDGA